MKISDVRVSSGTSSASEGYPAVPAGFVCRGALAVCLSVSPEPDKFNNHDTWGYIHVTHYVVPVPVRKPRAVRRLSSAFRQVFKPLLLLLCLGFASATLGTEPTVPFALALSRALRREAGEHNETHNIHRLPTVETQDPSNTTNPKQHPNADVS